MAGVVTEYPQVEFHCDKSKKFRWRLRSRNGHIIAASSQGYTRKLDCKASYELVVEMTSERMIEVIHHDSWN